MKDDRIYLEHIRDAINDISSYTNSGRETFFVDRMRQDATLRKLQVIGQAVKNLSETCKLREPEIPWKRIACRPQILHPAWQFGARCEIHPE